MRKYGFILWRCSNVSLSQIQQAWEGRQPYIVNTSLTFLSFIFLLFLRLFFSGWVDERAYLKCTPGLAKECRHVTHDIEKVTSSAVTQEFHAKWLGNFMQISAQDKAWNPACSTGRCKTKPNYKLFLGVRRLGRLASDRDLKCENSPSYLPCCPHSQAASPITWP